jgi:hypothetical protein
VAERRNFENSCSNAAQQRARLLFFVGREWRILVHFGGCVVMKYFLDMPGRAGV